MEKIRGHRNVPKDTNADSSEEILNRIRQRMQNDLIDAVTLEGGKQENVYCYNSEDVSNYLVSLGGGNSENTWKQRNIAPLYKKKLDK